MVSVTDSPDRRLRRLKSDPAPCTNHEWPQACGVDDPTAARMAL